MLSSDDMIESENTIQSIQKAPSSVRKKRIRFTTNLDILLLKAVIACNDHISPHGTKKNAAASGVAEVRGEGEVFLDEIVLAVDEMEEQRRTQQNSRTE